MTYKNFKIEHIDKSSYVVLRVDLSKVDHKYLELFLGYWDIFYDDDDILNEALSFIAIECFIESIKCNSYTTKGMMDIFKDKEGFPRLDGSSGISITQFSHFELEKEDFKITEIE